MGAERQRPQQRCREAVVSRSGFRLEACEGGACGSWVHSCLSLCTQAQETTDHSAHSRVGSS